MTPVVSVNFDAEASTLDHLPAWASTCVRHQSNQYQLLTTLSHASDLPFLGWHDRAVYTPNIHAIVFVSNAVLFYDKFHTTHDIQFILKYISNMRLCMYKPIFMLIVKSSKGWG
jgi:hypothetical protein